MRPLRMVGEPLREIMRGASIDDFRVFIPWRLGISSSFELIKLQTGRGDIRCIRLGWL